MIKCGLKMAVQCLGHPFSNPEALGNLRFGISVLTQFKLFRSLGTKTRQWSDRAAR